MAFTETKLRLNDGTQVCVWYSGELKDERPLLIAHHGAPGLSSHVEPMATFGFLADRFRIVVYDARGSGNSELKGPFTNPQWIADLDEIRAWAGAETFVLAGGSYGGFIALDYALAFPHRILAVVLRDTWACGPVGTHAALAKILTSLRIDVDVARQVRLWSGNVLDAQDFDKGIEEIMPIYVPENQCRHIEFESAREEAPKHYETHNAAFRESVPRFDVRARLHEIKVPTLVVVGRYDPICPPDAAQVIAESITTSQLVVFEHSGHHPPGDEPDKFQTVVSEFLDQVSSGTSSLNISIEYTK